MNFDAQLEKDVEQSEVGGSEIYLAMESHEVDSDIKVKVLVLEFTYRFRSIKFTLYPGDIPGEAPGKSSNVAWASRKASERYLLKTREEVIVTIFDADSHLSTDYFAMVTTMHLAYPETTSTTIYSAPIIFDRNAHNVPALVRTADILWCAAGLSGLYASSTIRPPTSVSLTLTLIDIVGGWDADSAAIGEDLHMYLKCFFALNGNLTQRTVLAPVSQSNVSSGLKGHRGRVQNYHARYKQALRHMWGSLDTGDLSSNSLSRLKTFNHHLPGGQGPIHYTVSSPNWKHVFYLSHRLFEAHFLPTHMTIFIISFSIYSFLTSASNTSPPPSHLTYMLTLTSYTCLLSFAIVALYMTLYETYHTHCIATRTLEMRRAGLYDGMKENENSFSYRSWRNNWIDYVVSPLVAPVYRSILASQAQIAYLWTRELVYMVSVKLVIGGSAGGSNRRENNGTSSTCKFGNANNGSGKLANEMA
ncbi:hypothetical protein B7463_g5849, partial [Scytalidium lignicola]